MVVFDATTLMLLMRPGAPGPLDPSTGKPVEFVEARLNALVDELEKAGTKILIPAPALSEILVRADAAGPGILAALQKHSVMSVKAFDTLAAIELAEIAKTDPKASKKDGMDGTWAKVKYDRQIEAIAKVSGAKALYTDDKNLINLAKRLNIPVVQIADIPVPIEATQGVLPLLAPEVEIAQAVNA